VNKHGVGLIETMWAGPAGIRFFGRHLERLAASAAALGLACDQAAIAAGARQAARGLEGDSRVRIQVEADGRFEVTVAPLGSLPPRPRVVVSAERLDSRDLLLRHKTTRRAVYEQARSMLGRVEGGFDALLVNERGELCEGGISNLFALLDDRLLTPPVAVGLLPGIMRGHVIEAFGATEAVLRPEDLRRARRIFLTNALRGMVEVELVD